MYHHSMLTMNPRTMSHITRITSSSSRQSKKLYTALILKILLDPNQPSLLVVLKKKKNCVSMLTTNETTLIS